VVTVAVIGAGAAGLTAAIFAARNGHRVVLLERTRDGGRKILVSGGGRCNVLPSVAAPERFVTDSSPNTLRKILLSWPLAEQRRFFEEEVGIPLALEAERGKLFPASNRARDVRDGLVALAARHGVERRFGALVAGLEPDGAGGWTVHLDDGPSLGVGAVIVATGGLSLPGTGSDGLGLDLLRQLGHTVHPTYPALTPLTADPPPHAPLAGISLNVTITAPPLPGKSGKPFTVCGGFLFTHHGYSGPAVLDISHLAVRSRLAGGPLQPLLVRWTDLDAAAWEEKLRTGSGASGIVMTPLRRLLPDRLAETLLSEAAIHPGRPLHQLRGEERRRLVELLTRYPLPWTGDEGYRKAEVTGGGVALSEIDPRSLESRRHPGLFLCGEVLDAFGPIGGHNFSWAWATGRAAGLAAPG
jgi:predicted Rossmann fold flavoprotein